MNPTLTKIATDLLAHPRVDFATTRAEDAQIDLIVTRGLSMARAQMIRLDRLTCEMDVRACHRNGCRLDFEKLLAAPDADFAHDFFGIRRHIDRDTGKLLNCFRPRCAAPGGAA